VRLASPNLITHRGLQTCRQSLESDTDPDDNRTDCLARQNEGASRIADRRLNAFLTAIGWQLLTQRRVIRSSI
jgi:hypothetical protein